MERDSEDDAWRSIVEHYGDRVPLDPDEPPRDEPFAEPRPAVAQWDDRGLDTGTDAGPDAGIDIGPDTGPDAVRDGDQERFVPPPPPPLPRVAPDRLLAWAGVFGAPVVLLAAVVFGVHLPAWLGYLLVAGFVGGFVYLVTRMPREPRDPADDGARL